MTQARKKGRLPLLLAVLAAALVLAAGGYFLLGRRGEELPPVSFESDRWAAECSFCTSEEQMRHLSDGVASFCWGRFTGAENLWGIRGEEAEEVTIAYTLTAEGGKADLVLLHPDNTVTRLSGESSPYTFTPQRDSMTYLRLIGDGGEKITAEITIQNEGGHWIVG